MKDKGIHKRLKKENGIYFVDIDITKEEWKEMLLDSNVFYKEAKDMILYWYNEEDYQATSRTIMTKYEPKQKGSPYNGIVKGLVHRIHKHLNYRFWVESESDDGKESFWCVPFEGWHIDFNESKNFVWKLRIELIEAINEIPEFNYENINYNSLNYENVLESIVPAKEGKKIMKYTTIYERNPKNRQLAIAYLKNVTGKIECQACGFDFEKVYGEVGKDFIEVHHNEPLHMNEKETNINIKEDLDCICSNCHRMIHRNKSELLTVQQLKNKIKKNKENNN